MGLRCVAAPVFDEHGQPVAALSLSGPGARVDETRLAELGRLTAQIAGEFSAELGGHSAARRPRISVARTRRNVAELPWTNSAVVFHDAEMSSTVVVAGARSRPSLRA